MDVILILKEKGKNVYQVSRLVADQQFPEPCVRRSDQGQAFGDQASDT